MALLLPSSQRCDVRRACLRQEGGRGDYNGRLSVAGRPPVNGKMTTASKDPSPPDAGVSRREILPLVFAVAFVDCNYNDCEREEGGGQTATAGGSGEGGRCPFFGCGRQQEIRRRQEGEGEGGEAKFSFLGRGAEDDRESGGDCDGNDIDESHVRQG